MALVFAYGSLAAPGLGRPAELRDARVFWGVAMDNAVAVPGYKVFEDAQGRRPDARIAFVDLDLDAAGTRAPGMLLDAPDLGALDRRERQYARVDVTARVTCADGGAPPGPVWAYVGRPEARARTRRPPVLVARAYLELLPDGVPAPPFAVAELVRVDL